MDPMMMFIGIGAVAIITMAISYPYQEGRRIARNIQRQSYRNLYSATRASRSRYPVHGSAFRDQRHFGSWTEEDGNPVGYYGRMLWVRILERTKRYD